MSKSNTLETQLLDYIFTNVAPAWASDSDLYISLHTADPGEAGTQATNEANYTSYARVAVARSTSGWTTSGNQVTNDSLIQFPLCTGGSSVCTHFAVGRLSSGTGQIYYKGALSSSISVSNGIQPQFNASGIVITED